MGCGREQGSCESSSRRGTDGDGPHRLRLSKKRFGHNPPVPCGLRAAFSFWLSLQDLARLNNKTHLLRCRHLTMGAIACVPDASHLDPRRS